MGKPWVILEKLASQKVTEVNRSLNQINLRLAALEQRRSQILVLIAQNKDRLNGKKQSCSMAEVQVVTVFLRNLGAALRGTEQEISEVQEEKERLRLDLTEKLKEKNKMTSLMEREVKKESERLELIGQKQSDEAGIRAHNLKKASG